MDDRRVGVDVAVGGDFEGAAPIPPPPVGAEGRGAVANGPDPVGGAPGRVAARRNGRRGLVRFDARGFREAVRILEDVNDRRPINRLYVRGWGGEDQGEDGTVIERDDALSFPRFVELLGQREGARAVDRITLLAVDWSRLLAESMETLFSSVFPGHPSLKSIDIDISRLPARLMRILSEALPTVEGMLSSLGFDDTLAFAFAEQVDRVNYDAIAQAIVAMLDRNAAFSRLGIDLRLDANQSRSICQAVARNTHLRSLRLNIPAVSANTLEGIGSSALRILLIPRPVSDEAVSSLATQLRTNETLEFLSLSVLDDGHQDPQAVLELVRTYNCTLRRIGGSFGSRHGDDGVREQFRRYLSRNARIRRGLEHLRLHRRISRSAARQVQDDDPFGGTLLPHVLGLASDVPTALCRILKMGYVNQVSELLKAQVTATAPAPATATAASNEASSESPSERGPPSAKRQRIDGGDAETGSPSAI